MKIEAATRLVVLIPLTVLSLTCGAPRDASRHICDGSPTTRLAILSVPHVARLLPGSQVMADNGSWYLFVDGTCRYWASSPDEPWEDVHTGMLDQSAAAELEDSIHFQQWGALAGQWQGSGGPDANSVIFHDGTLVVACHAFCDVAGVPPEVHAMRDAEVDTIRRLWARGAAIDGPVRMMAVAFDPNATVSVGIQAFVWPATVDLSAIALSEATALDAGFGMGRLLTGDDAISLRAIRRAYLRGDQGDFWYRYLPAVDAAGSRYRVYLRDTLPFERTDGLVPEPTGAR